MGRQYRTPATIPRQEYRSFCSRSNARSIFASSRTSYMFALSRRRRRLSDSGPEEKSRNPNPASTFVVVPVVQFPNACPTRLAVYGRSAEYCMGTDTHSGNLATAMLAIVKSCAAKVEKQASSERDLIETQLCLCSLYGGPCYVPDRSHGRGLFV
jgi:hypothetical protein